ncbi:hypothetical protein [Blastococcus sp. SYSU D00820]
MSRGRPGRAAAALLTLLAPAAGGCTSGVEGAATAQAADPTPDSAEELSALLVTEVPSDLARVPDDEIEPPAGEKTADDVAGYAEDPAYERQVLDDYGYRYGWERFWGDPARGPVTTVFVDQFDTAEGALAYAEDLAGDGAEYYEGMLRHDPPQLPGDCRLLTVEEVAPETGLTGPAAFAWCVRGVFSVAVSAVAATVDAADAEVTALVPEQLDRLPGG